MAINISILDCRRRSVEYERTTANDILAAWFRWQYILYSHYDEQISSAGFSYFLHFPGFSVAFQWFPYTHCMSFCRFSYFFLRLLNLNIVSGAWKDFLKKTHFFRGFQRYLRVVNNQNGVTADVGEIKTQSTVYAVTSSYCGTVLVFKE